MMQDMNFILKSSAAQPFFFFFLLATFSKLAESKFNMDKKKDGFFWFSSNQMSTFY
jgi:hypothetical protein